MLRGGNRTTRSDGRNNSVHVSHIISTKSIDKAMELMPDSPFPFIAKGMRDRDTPWPLQKLQVGERFMKAIENDPGYLNSDYELAVLYQV